MNEEQATTAVLNHLKAQRPTLREYLRTMQDTCAGCDKEWEAAGAIPNSRYCRGQWYAYRDIERMIEQDGFNEEPREELERLIRCGLAGFTPEQIAPLFHGHPGNVRLPKEFVPSTPKP